MSFSDYKWWIMGLTGLERDALHIYVGVSVYLLMLLFLRWRNSERYVWALVVVLVAALLGEYFDARQIQFQLERSHIKASVHDIINTCMLPFVLYAISKVSNLLGKFSR